MTSAINDPDEAAFAAEHPRAYAAIGYGQRGWRVLRVHWINHGRCTCLAGDATTCASAGKHPMDSNWPDEATTDIQEIIRMWGETPEANVGIATGAASGIFVLDVDEGVRPDGTYKQGLESKIDLEDHYDELPETYTVTTGGGGNQYYFRQPAGYSVKSLSKGKIGEPALGPDYPDIDLRGDGGMVVAPPSVSGRGPYSVDNDVEVADPPQWLIDLLLQRGIMEPYDVPPDPDPDGSVTAAVASAPVIAQSEAPAWLESSIMSKLDAVRTAPPGTANITNNRVAYMIGQYIPHGWITHDEAVERLTGAAAARTQPNAEAEFTIRRAVRQGMQQPYQDLGQASQTGDLSDSIMSGRVASELLAGRYCWVFGMDWLKWTGHVWKMCADVDVIHAVKTHLLEQVKESLAAVSNNAAARKALSSLLSKSRINAIISLARGDVQVDPEEFDRHPDLLNTPNGVVDLRTGETGPGDPFLYLTKITDVGYVKGATHEDWDAALEAVPDDVRGWFQYRMGQAITGYTPPDDSMLLLQGTGANGKTTITNTIAKTIGTYYAMVPSSALIGKQEDPHALMPFMGARVAVVEELPEGRRLNVTRLKETVGTPTMTGRYMYKSLITWDASHCLMITTNYVPTVSETDSGTWRRLKMITFPFQFVKPGQPLEGPRDRHGDQQLRFRLAAGRAQREAALAWLVAGAQMWYEHDRAMPEDPEQVDIDTNDWRGQADQILAVCWRDLLVADPGSHVIGRDLYEIFTERILAMGHQRIGEPTFVMKFGQHEETAKARVVRDQIRTRPGLSRPRMWPRRTADDAPQRYTAWLGVRFRDQDGTPEGSQE